MLGAVRQPFMTLFITFQISTNLDLMRHKDRDKTKNEDKKENLPRLVNQTSIESSCIIAHLVRYELDH